MGCQYCVGTCDGCVVCGAALGDVDAGDVDGVPDGKDDGDAVCGMHVCPTTEQLG